MDQPDKDRDPQSQPSENASILQTVADLVDAVLARQGIYLPHKGQSRWKRTRPLQGGTGLLLWRKAS
ncbi:MAG: hypothetical protein HY532_02770 [Chloroflexi bacterium]|nr:hypothetical protein [Chloroflexota bacterium]